MARFCRINHPPSCPLLEGLLPRGSMVAAAVDDPQRQIATINYRIAKGSFDHLVGSGEQRDWECDALASEDRPVEGLAPDLSS